MMGEFIGMDRSFTSLRFGGLKLTVSTMFIIKIVNIRMLNGVISMVEVQDFDPAASIEYSWAVDTNLHIV